MRPEFRLVLASLLFCSMPAAVGGEHYHEKAFNADTREKFEQVAQSVRGEMKTGGRYQYVTAEERRTIDAALQRMTSLFAVNESVQAMSQDSKVQLFNEQEVVNSILTHRDRDRVICQHEVPIGSHIPITKCHTYGQEVEGRRETTNQMDQWRRGPCRGEICSDRK